MARTRYLIVGLALLVVAVCTSACTVSLGHPSNQASTASTSAPATSAAPVAITSSAAPTSAAPTVTITKHPKSKVVTHVVEQGQDQDPQYAVPQPSSYSSVLSVYDSAMSAEDPSFYNGNGAFFVSPSGNIACYLSESVSCSIHRYDFPQPGPDCDAGIGAQLDGYGNAGLTDCSGYFGTNIGAGTLQYGQSIAYGDFACVSESSAISCLDFDTDTGFSLSRAAFTPVS